MKTKYIHTIINEVQLSDFSYLALNSINVPIAWNQKRFKKEQQQYLNALLKYARQAIYDISNLGSVLNINIKDALQQGSIFDLNVNKSLANKWIKTNLPVQRKYSIYRILPMLSKYGVPRVSTGIDARDLLVLYNYASKNPGNNCTNKIAAIQASILVYDYFYNHDVSKGDYLQAIRNNMKFNCLVPYFMSPSKLGSNQLVTRPQSLKSNITIYKKTILNSLDTLQDPSMIGLVFFKRTNKTSISPIVADIPIIESKTFKHMISEDVKINGLGNIDILIPNTMRMIFGNTDDEEAIDITELFS